MVFLKREETIKKLLYRSCNRGCKETDLIIGSFARENIDKMTDEELKAFSELLKLPDADIYDWYIKKKPLPVEKINPVVTRLLNFIP
ncbi:MAG: succinate dehydrogenase assembly factor 2 [Rickettsiaceae bacterium]|jgi:antitoxin CptB|nr:succinate dehydrogenase assembly factor 2 [Rickettsiaceae bacterium]MCP5378372.1 succinate dehydrogenase assembly factor 2 [Rickettsiaceae bacterium]WPX99600.1 Succinate dehydrogenase assembly factor [Candidatus Megaera polyxenophila]